MRLRVILAFLGLSGIAPAALADDWYEVAIYKCDHSQNAVTIEMVGAYNEDGRALLSATHGVQNLTNVVGRNDRSTGQGGRWKTYRACDLSGGIVELRSVAEHVVTPDGINRECGLWASYKIDVRFNGRRMADVVPEEWCSASDVVSAVRIDGSSGAVNVKVVPSEAKYKRFAPGESQVMSKGRSNYASLTKEELVWFNVQHLTNVMRVGGMPSPGFCGAEDPIHYRDCIRALKEIGALDMARAIERMVAACPFGVPFAFAKPKCDIWSEGTPPGKMNFELFVITEHTTRPEFLARWGRVDRVEELLVRYLLRKGLAYAPSVFAATSH